MKSLALLALIPGMALAQTVPTGTQAFADLGIPMANGSPTGNILTATQFTIGDLVSTAAQSGVFTGMPLQSFGEITFNIAKRNSFDFKDGTFGEFRSTFIDPTVTGTSITFFMVGNWTPGTQGKVAGGSFPSDLTISFTQTPAGNGVLSDSATFSTPSAVGTSVPAPEDFFAVNTLLGAGLAGVYYFTRRRK